MNKNEMKEMLIVVYELMASDEFTEAIATMMWNIYTKLKTKGFSDEQAMSIALHFAKSNTSNK